MEILFTYSTLWRRHIPTLNFHVSAAHARGVGIRCGEDYCRGAALQELSSIRQDQNNGSVRLIYLLSVNLYFEVNRHFVIEKEIWTHLSIVCR